MSGHFVILRRRYWIEVLQSSSGERRFLNLGREVGIRVVDAKTTLARSPRPTTFPVTGCIAFCEKVRTICVLSASYRRPQSCVFQ